MAKKQGDTFTFIIGILIMGVLVWQFGGYLLPDKAEEITGESFLDDVLANAAKEISWEEISRLTFNKAFHLYKEDGSIELAQKELHSYDFTTGTNRLIQWKQDSLTYNLIEKDSILFQTVNKQIDSSATRDQLQNKLNSSTFVIGLPFTLKNDSNTKTYHGITTFEGVPAHELEVTFNGSLDIWRLYYAEDTLDWLGYWVQTDDHYSLVINEDTVVERGFTFSQKRKSYRTDAQKNRLYLRADYQYSNFKID